MITEERLSNVYGASINEAKLMYNALPFIGIDNDNLHDLFSIEINPACPCNERAINNSLEDDSPKFEILSKRVIPATN